MVIIITRHAGAVYWLRQHGIVTDDVRTAISTDEIDQLTPYSVIVGVLPMHLAVAAIQAGHRFMSIQLQLTDDLRGRELTADDMDDIASLEELQLQWRRTGNWSSDTSECFSGIPEASAGDHQQFRIGLVPRTAADIVTHEMAVAEGWHPHFIGAARYQAVDVTADESD